MNDRFFEIESNEKLTENVMRMRLRGDTSEITSPGQFVNLKLEGFYLRRPISVCDLDGERLTLIYKIVGRGTESMSAMGAGERLSLLTGLGNGYNLEKSGEKPLLIGGGVGVPPLYLLAKKLIAQGKKTTVVLGFNTKKELFYENEFAALGAQCLVTTADGSCGIKGFVTDAFQRAGDYSYTYSCGPEPMLRAVYNAAQCGGQFSFEERMGCGFGVCMGCTCQTKYGAKRICKDGPVLEREEIIW